MANDPTIFDLLMPGDGTPAAPRPLPTVVPEPAAIDDTPVAAAVIDAAIAALRTHGSLLPTCDLPPAPRGERVWVYDTEVFPNLVLHVFTDGVQTEVFHHGCWDALRAFVNDPRKVFAGFNSADYDDPVLRFILRTPTAIVADVLRLSGTIIEERAPSDLRWGTRPWAFSIDVLQLLNGRGSLKEWECKLAMDRVAESPHPFDQPLPPSAIADVVRYCLNDVDATVRLLLRNWDLVQMREVLQGIYGQSDNIYASGEAGIAEGTLVELARRATGVTHAQLKAAAAASPDNRPRIWSLAELIAPRTTFTTAPYRNLLERLRAGELHISERGGGHLELPELPGMVFDAGGVRYQLGTGGLHSLDQPGTWIADDSTGLLDLDVTSYYPSLIINEGWYPRHYGPAFLDHLRSMRDRRVAAKNAGDKRTATALKIVINSIYGKLNDTYSAIRSVPDAFRVTLNGQLHLLMLIEALGLAGARVLSANTDGVTIRVARATLDQRLPAVIAEWERHAGLTLERSDYRAFWRRDVNNYLAVMQDGTLKTRGAFGDGTKGDGAVIREAAIAWLIDGVEPADTVARADQVLGFLFYQRTRSDAVLLHGERELGRIARWYAGFGGPPLRRRTLGGEAATTVPHGHQARLALDITGWTMADLVLLDRSAYTAEAWRLIRSVEGDG
ncbi:MAG TPA: hypothetical protein VHX44_11060 [Planctomycetota bacterium]|nr:hypothetical protein [Planctomycetota bacterium]